MRTKKRTVAIGDIHGRKNWTDIVTDPKNAGSRFVFLGDYVDPYDNILPEELLKNINDIIDFKIRHMDDVILLLGNHDMHYINHDFPKGTRYDDSIAERIESVFNNHRSLFLYAYQEDKTIFTHAGISDSWWQEDFLPLVENPSMIYKNKGILDIASILNNANKEQLMAMFQISRWRGGHNDNGGIFWADKNETIDNPLRGFHQVVGHTRVYSILTNITDIKTKITYCDCLSSGEYYSQLL